MDSAGAPFHCLRTDISVLCWAWGKLRTSVGSCHSGHETGSAAMLAAQSAHGRSRAAATVGEIIHQPVQAAEGRGLVADLSPEAARAKVQSAFGDIRAELERLVRIPSVSAPDFNKSSVRHSALATASWLRRSGFEDVRLLEVEGAH